MKSKVNKEKPLKGSALWGLLLFGILLLVDMVTKIAADEYFSRPDAPQKIEVIPGWISLCITHNRGIAYGIGGSSPTWVKLLVIGMTAVMMLVFSIVYFKLNKRRSFLRTAIVFIVAGGVGNLIDRVYFRVWDVTTLGGVRDMVDLSRFGFAVCNFADFFITGGAVALVLSLLFFDRDALCPVGKYKRMAQEAKAAEEQATTVSNKEEKSDESEKNIDTGVSENGNG